MSAELADRLEDHFFETESAYWGVMQREREDPYEIFGFFPDEATADHELAALQAAFPEMPEAFEQTTICDEDWQNAYKVYVQPWSDRQLHWIPVWEREQIQPPQDAAVVYLDAGMAFGTGAHETTRLCARRLLDFIEGHADRVDEIDVIDAGCGSGVLALSAAALGFKRVYGFDCDPEAIRICKENAASNRQIGQIGEVHFAVADLELGLRGRRADLILANIQTDVLIPHADVLVQAVQPNGSLALSGILSKEIDQVRNHYFASFRQLFPDVRIQEDSRVEGEWADLLMKRIE